VILYRVKLQADGKGLLVTSPDFAELATFGKNEADALRRAVGAFEEAIAARMSERLEIPAPSKGRLNEPRVKLSLQAEFKILLYRTMLSANVRKADLARKMDLPRQEIDRLLDLNHGSNLGKMEAAFLALDRRLNFKVTDLP
jgi:antitoxin HicB